MPSRNFGWVQYGATGTSPPPLDVTQLRVILTINANDAGFYWTVNPGREVLKSMATGGNVRELVCHLDIEGLPPEIHLQWDEPFLTLDPRIPKDKYALRENGPMRLLVLTPPIPDGIWEFQFNLTYRWQKTVIQCHLDPEIDLGMESPPS